MTAPAMTVSSQPLPGGDPGTAKTVKAMHRLVIQGMTDPAVRFQALQITQGVSGRDPVTQIQSLRSWLADRWTFVRDPSGAELLHGAPLLLTMAQQNGTIQADCDDAAILSAALAKAIGLNARFVVVGFLASNAPFRHVWTEVTPANGPQAGQWFEFDVTRQAQNIPVEQIGRTWIVDLQKPVAPTVSWPLLLGGIAILWWVLKRSGSSTRSSAVIPLATTAWGLTRSR